jgi:hypothetical protein
MVGASGTSYVKSPQAQLPFGIVLGSVLETLMDTGSETWTMDCQIGLLVTTVTSILHTERRWTPGFMYGSLVTPQVS